MEEQQDEVVRRGPGRPPKVATESTEAVRASDVDEITYVPDPTDPPTTKWNGIAFRAGVPVKISRTHTVLVPLREEFRQADGTIITRAREQRIPMVEQAKNNPRFSVNGVAPVTQKMGTARVPTSPDEYRGYAISWIIASTAPSQMELRWDAEESLRDKCGVDDKDIAYLRPFFEAQLLQLAA